MSKFRVVICGGGIAATEGLLRLRRLAGDAVDVTVVAPNDHLHYRPLAVQEPFARPSARRYPLRRILQDGDAEWLQGTVDWIDADGQVVHTGEGQSAPFDALLLAVGGRPTVTLDHVTVFDDARADETFNGLVKDVEDGYTKLVALVVPDGPAWPLPVYELALMTAERAYSSGMDDTEIVVVTPEPAPLAAFGERASGAIGEVLERSRVRVITGSHGEVPASRRLVVQPSGDELEPQRIVALPRVDGPGIRGLPAVDGGFIPIDDRCRVEGVGEHVFAAGDATNFPIKHGGLGAQQADTAAAGIAALQGAAAVPEPLSPVMRGVLYTGREPLYLTTVIVDGRAGESEITRDAPWPEEQKVVAEELGPYLSKLDARR
ncbi:MAG TPA: FAD-dependent oxidoreductase [Thermoleophilaceae bacterium]